MRESGGPSPSERRAGQEHKGRVNRLIDTHKDFVDKNEVPGGKTESLMLSKPTETGDVYFIAHRTRPERIETEGKKALTMQVWDKKGPKEAHSYVRSEEDGAVYRIDSDIKGFTTSKVFPQKDEVSSKVLDEILSQTAKQKEHSQTHPVRVAFDEMEQVLALAEQAKVIPVSFTELEQIYAWRTQGLEPTQEASIKAAKEFTSYVKDFFRRQGNGLDTEKLERHVALHEHNEVGDTLKIDVREVQTEFGKAPLVIVDCAETIEDKKGLLRMRDRLIYGIEESGTLITMKQKDISVDGNHVPASETAALADSLEARKIRNFLNHPRFS